METRAHVAELRNELDSLKKIQEELQKNAAEGVVQKTEVRCQIFLTVSPHTVFHINDQILYMDK